LFVGNLFTAASALSSEQLPQQVLGLIRRACSVSRCAIRSSTIRRNIFASSGSCCGSIGTACRVQKIGAKRPGENAEFGNVYEVSMTWRT
jgi:hypothetical protein